MKKVIEFQGAEIAVVLTREKWHERQFIVSVFSANRGVIDYSDLLYSESAETIQGAFAAFQKIAASLKRGRFPWEVEDE